MVLYISKPLWKSFQSNKDDFCDPYISSAKQPTKIHLKAPQTEVNTTTDRGRSQTRPKRKRVGPKIRIIAPPSPPDVAPGTHPNDLLPEDDNLLAAPLPSQQEIRKVLASSHSPVSLRAVSPIEFLPSLDTLTPTRSPTRYAMSRGSGVGRLRLRTKHLLLPHGRTESVASFSLFCSYVRRNFKKADSTSTSSPVVLNPRLVASPDRLRASGTWVRDRQGNPFWMNGMLDDPVHTVPRTIVVDAKGAPEMAVSVSALSRKKKASFGKVRLYL